MSRAEANESSAIALLMADHAQVKEMFRRYEALRLHGSVADKKKLADRICSALSVHAAIEEEIFYPEVRAAIGEDALLDEAEVEHAGAKHLIVQIDHATPGTEHYDAKVCVLGDQVAHHIQEEERELFPRVRRSGLDLDEMGSRMSALKAELEAGADLGRASWTPLARDAWPGSKGVPGRAEGAAAE